MNCNSCEALYINGVLCHEHGCPDSWKDEQRTCKECGTVFFPEDSGQEVCSEECAHVYY
jgi:hypothetical protein